jgi:L,D-transpeptidase catalytic domain
MIHTLRSAELARGASLTDCVDSSNSERHPRFLRFLGLERNLAGGMRKATSISADDGKSAKPSQVKPGKKSAPKKAIIGKQAAAAEPLAKVPALHSLGQRIAEAKKLEALDRPKASGAAAKETKKSARGLALAAAASAAHPLRNSDFPETYIQQISVKLDDPNHPVTLSWTGPQAAGQETGPFRSSPGAGLKGLNCDNTATSRRNGSKCTPKGTFAVSGFQDHLNSDSRATFVTWFVRERGIALHYFPSVPKSAASHGCVRLELKRVAQLIQSNSRTDLTSVVIDGTWTKPAKQW